MLVYKADRRTLGFVATYFALLVALWVWSPTQWYFWVPLFLALCSFSWFCAVITHNTIHTPIFHSERLNRLFQVVLTLTYGHPVSSYVSGHNLSHHMYAQEDRDIMRTYKVRSQWNLVNLALFFPTVINGIMKSDFEFTRAMKDRLPTWYRQFWIELSVLAAATVTLVVLDWQKALVLWIIPHIWAAWGIISINYLQHDGCDDTHPVNNSRNFTSRFFGWWTFNNGFHGVHHRYPDLHWSLCREVHDKEFAPTIDPRLDQPSIAKYFFKAFIFPGKRVRYDGAPVELPPVDANQKWWPEPGEPIPEKVSFGAVGAGR